MKWNSAPLRQVAPPDRSKVRFAPDEQVWHLQLDQVESQTGRILKKVHARAGEAGSSTFAFDKENVLYSKLRPYLNKVVRPDEPGLATTELVPLRPVSEVLDPDFLAYFLRSEAFVNFANLTVAGAKMPRMIMDKFWEHHIPLPPLREQRLIVELLDQADSLRRKRVEADDLSARLLPSLFRKMFGDPESEKTVFKRCSLGDVIVEATYGTSNQSNTESKGVVVIRMNNIRSDGQLDLLNIKHVALSEDELFKYRLRSGDILFNRTNSHELVGKTGIWRQESEAVVASYLIRIRVNENKCKPEFIWAWMNTPYIKKELFKTARRAAGMANINTSELRKLPLILPPISAQQDFIKKLYQFNDCASTSASSRYQLERLFQAMLHRAFNGELTAGWREAHMKEILTEMEHQSKALGKREEAA